MIDKNTRNIINNIRKIISESNDKLDLPKSNKIYEKGNEDFNLFKKILKESEESDIEKPYVISSSNVQFGSVRASQEETIKKTVGDVSFKPDSLKYFPQKHDVVMNAEVSGLGIPFQFRYKDPSGDGCYIWTEGLQLTDANLRTIQKIRDAFLNWKQSLVEDGDLMQKLDKEANKDN